MESDQYLNSDLKPRLFREKAGYFEEISNEDVTKTGHFHLNLRDLQIFFDHKKALQIVE